MKKDIFDKHFRIYFKNGHPAYIVDEEGNMYIFHRVTHSKTSGGRKNFEIENPLVNGGERATYLVKRAEKDKKGRFSLFELELKPGVDANNLKIKNAGGSQPNFSRANGVNNVTTSNGVNMACVKANHTPSKNIKTKKQKRYKTK